MKLSVLIPIYNEEATLEAIVQKVLSAPFELEVLLIDDCSQDSSREIMERLATQHAEIRSIHLSTNLGKGGAIATGMEHFSGDVVLIQDADLEYNPDEYTRLVQPIVDDLADVVYGSRFSGQSHRVLYFWHSVGNRLLTTMSNVVTDLNLTDMETCYKVFRREIIQRLQLEEDRFGIEPEMTAKLSQMAGIRIWEVPISYNGRTYAEGKKIGVKDGVRAIYAITKYGVVKRFLG